MNLKEKEVKVVLLGDTGFNFILNVYKCSQGVGKTSIINRLCQN